MKDRRLSLQLSASYERFRGSLFYVPAIYVVAAAVLAWASSRLDRILARDLPQVPVLLPTTVDSARSILATIAGATITVAGVVFSLTVIAVQLASSQFTPRALRGLLRDRFSQNTIGIAVATFTYCLLVLSVTRASGPGLDQPLQNISVTIAVAMSVITVLAIVAFLDHITRSMRVGEIIRRTGEETHRAVRSLLPERGEGATADDEDTPVPDRTADLTVHVSREGWVQLIHAEAILRSLPAGATARLATRAGDYVIRGRPLVEVWGDVEDPTGLERDLRRAFAVGDERTMQQDVAFGIRQLVDIALRALSPSVNDPTTAIEAILRLGGLIREIAVRDLAPRVLRDEHRTLIRGDELDFGDILRYGFRQIRGVAVRQPGVVKMLVGVLGEVAEELRELGLDARVELIREEVRLTLAALESHGHIEEDVVPIRATAEGYGLI